MLKAWTRYPAGKTDETVTRKVHSKPQSLNRFDCPDLAPFSGRAGRSSHNTDSLMVGAISSPSLRLWLPLQGFGAGTPGAAPTKNRCG